MEIHKVLILAPHPDDAEFGCGATIDKFIKEGKEVFMIVFSPCNKSLPAGYKENDIYRELDKSATSLGIPESNLFKLDYPVREFSAFRQEILEQLIKFRKEISPDLVILPNSKDIHQDHYTIHQEGIRAFKSCKLIGYELPWNNLEFTSNFHIKVSTENLSNKFKAISCYKSQQHRAYNKEDFFEGLAKIRGVQINTEFAEAFELIRWWM